MDEDEVSKQLLNPIMNNWAKHLLSDMEKMRKHNTNKLVPTSWGLVRPRELQASINQLRASKELQNNLNQPITIK